jgi:hypothetical protein
MEGPKIIEGPAEGVVTSPSSGKSGVVWEDLVVESCLPILVGARNWGIPVGGNCFPVLAPNARSKKQKNAGDLP